MSRLSRRLRALGGGLVVLLAGVAVSAVAGSAAAGAAAPSERAHPAVAVLAWGFSNEGALGEGSVVSGHVPAPVQVPVGTTITAVAAGTIHSLAVTSTGQVLAWGSNAFGQLGDGTTTDSHVPVPVTLPAGTTVTAIAAGNRHSLALTSTGHVLAWGGNFDGQLGDGSTHNRDVPVPVQLSAGTTVTAIAAVGDFSLALTANGQVLAWGSNSDGQLGDGSFTTSAVPVPVQLPAGTTVTSIAGNDHSLALTSTRQVLAWGYNLHGQLGDGTTTDRDVPVPVQLPAGTTVTAIAAGGYYSLAPTSTGPMLAWGDNPFGELGNGTTTDSHVPVPVQLPAGTTVTAIAAGYTHSLAIVRVGPRGARGGRPIRAWPPAAPSPHGTWAPPAGLAAAASTTTPAASTSPFVPGPG